MAKKINLGLRNYNFGNDEEEKFESFPHNTLVKIPLSMIEIGENIRNVNEDDELDELGETIKEHGQLEPCVVFERNNKYYIKVGSRRFKACSQAGIETLDCIITDDFEDEKDRIITQAIENEHRRDMNSREREKYLSELVKLGMSQVEIAKALHKSKGWISEALKAREYAEKNADIMAKIPDGVSTRTIYNMSKLSDEQITDIIEEAKNSDNTAEEKSFSKKVEQLAKNKKEKPEELNKKELEDSFSIEFDDDFTEIEPENAETELNLDTEESSSMEINGRISLSYTLNELEKTITLNDDPNDLEDIEKYITVHLKNYYIEKGYSVK